MDMGPIGLRELQQNASEIVRRVEAGATGTITVSGRPAAALRGTTARSWRRYEDIADLFAGPDGPASGSTIARCLTTHR
jgi:prevent-host-death family protein